MRYHAIHKLVYALLAAVLIAGCSSTTVKSTAPIALEQETAAIPEAQLLDVGVLTFDPGLDSGKHSEYTLPEVRNAEARYFANQLVDTLQQSAAWGPVRVIPSDDSIVDLYVEGTIIHSDGERLELAILARDTSGKVWLDRNYREVASKYAYDERNRNRQRDPFQNLYNRVANDLLEIQRQLPDGRPEELRTLSELRFARQFAPEAYSDYLRENRRGELEVVRLPADNDPLMTRIQRIRERDYLFVDTLQEYYDAFSRRMDRPYGYWRAETYDEILAVRQTKRQANARLVGGIAAIAAGILATGSDNRATRTAGAMGIGSGGMLIQSALGKRQEAEMHVASLIELGESLEADIEPQVIELEDRTITLSGNAQAQYDQWKDILHQIYETERGGI